MSSTLSIEELPFLGSGGNGDEDGLLLSSCIGEKPGEGDGGGNVVVDFFACFLECIATIGCSSRLLPGHGAVTDTSLQGNCS